MKTILILALFTSLLAIAAPGAAESRTISQTELVRRTQQLLDAFAPGDQAPWKLYLADDVLFFNEQGKSMDKSGFLADLQPLPPGFAGSLKVTNAIARFAKEVAILSVRRR